MNKAQPLGSFKENGLIHTGRCGLASATVYTPEAGMEIVLYDAVDAGDDELELLHAVVQEGTSVLNLDRPKVVTKGIYLVIKVGSGGVNVDIVP